MKIPQLKVKYIGAVKNILTRSMFYLSLINFLMLAITSYTVVISGIINVPFWVFILGLACIVVVALVFEYCVMLPSEMAFINHQVYVHNNPIKNDLGEIKDQLDVLTKQQRD